MILLFCLLSKPFASGHCAITIDRAPTKQTETGLVSFVLQSISPSVSDPIERLKTSGWMRLKIETSNVKKTQDFSVTPYESKLKFYIKSVGKALVFVALGAIGHFLYTLI